MEKTKKSGNKEKKIAQKFVVDCSKPVEDKVFSTNAFAEFLKERIKVNNKTGNLGSEITVSSDAKNVTVNASNSIR
jgi:large subunit ribosomal protein L22e